MRPASDETGILNGPGSSRWARNGAAGLFCFRGPRASPLANAVGGFEKAVNTNQTAIVV